MSTNKPSSAFGEALKALLPLAIQELAEAIPRWIANRRARRAAKAEGIEFPTPPVPPEGIGEQAKPQP